MAKYNKEIMEYFINPKNQGEIVDYSGVGESKNDSCNDLVRVYLKIKNDTIIKAKYEVYGCVGACVTSEVGIDLIINQSVCSALTLEKQDIIEKLPGLPEDKIDCSKLIIEAIKNAVDDYYLKEPEKYVEEKIINCSYSCSCCKNKCHNH